jgi:tRNA modification GTPase
VAVTLLDTAGMRDSADTVEQLGVERSAAAAAAADVVVMVVDGSQGWTDADGEVFDSLWGKEGAASSACRVKGPALLVANKSDLAAGRALPLPLLPKEVFQAVVPTSALTRDGLPQLDAALLQLAGAPQLAAGGVSWAVNERQAEALVRAHEALSAACGSIAAGMPLDCWTIDLRAALLALGDVGGEGVSEQVLDAVFSKFCIGK